MGGNSQQESCTIWSRTRSGQLRDLGIESGDRVAYMLDNNLDLIVLIFSLMLIGSIQIPINTKLRNDSLKFIVSHCEAKLVLAEEGYQSILTPLVSPQLADGTYLSAFAILFSVA